MTSRAARWLDDRLGAARFARHALKKIFPDHWSFMLGEIALFAFIVLVGTGIFLAMFFSASETPVVYDGSYEALRGETMSAAYRSALEISFDVPAGLLIRQIHHWAALVFIAAIGAHLARIFFTGAYRRPREINWIIGMTLLLLGILNGFTGYSVPDDLLSGTGLRIAYSVLLSVPLIGDWLAFIFFGGEVPHELTVSRLYGLHIIVPFFILALLTVHLLIVWRQKHTNLPGPGRSDAVIVGSRLWPAYAAKSTGLLFITFGVIAALGGLVQINPVWLYGPFDPASVSSGSQPDWYVIWLEGALRLFPGFDLHLGGRTIPGIFFPGILIPAIFFAILYAWPFIYSRITGDHGDHHLLQRPSETPVRTAIGVAVIAFFLVLTVAGGQDVLAAAAGVSVIALRLWLQILLFVAPAAAAAVTYLLCRWATESREFEGREKESR